jgi:hypothetical protein
MTQHADRETSTTRPISSKEEYRAPRMHVVGSVAALTAGPLDYDAEPYGYMTYPPAGGRGGDKGEKR